MYDMMELRRIMERQIQRPRHGHPFRPTLGPGCYILHDVLAEDILPEAKSLSYDANEIVVVRDERLESIRGVIGKFLESRERFHELGYLHKGGLVLHGPPGSGKTTIMRQVIEDCVEAGGVVFVSQSPYVLSQSLTNFRNMDATTPVFVVIEDIDTVVRSWGEYDLLEMLDGVKSIDGCFFLATVNEEKSVHPRLFRKGRFDQKVVIPYPSAEQRIEYVKAKAAGVLKESDMRAVAAAAEGLGFASIDYVVKQVACYGTPVAEAIEDAKAEERDSSAGDRNDIGFASSKY